MKKTILIYGLTLLTLSCETKQQPELSSQPLISYFESSSIPSAIMGYIGPAGNPKWIAFGPSIWNGKDTVSADNIFRIHSMTKSITTVAALQLVEKGMIKLDEPLNDLMPEMVGIPILDEENNLIKTDSPITLRQLLTHTAGFSYKFMSKKLQNFKPDKWEYEDMPRLFEPGAKWQYGTNIDWVGKIVEKVSGDDLETYFRNNITDPLKMSSTWFNVPDELKGKIVSWGKKDSTGKFIEYPRIPEKPVTAYNAGGGLFSSPNDYMKFLQCLMNHGAYYGGNILKKTTVEVMLRDHLPIDLALDTVFHKSDRWGLGWAIEATEEDTVRPMGVAYWEGAANSYFTLDVENNVAIVYFTQFFPFGENETMSFYRLFEKEVYALIN